MLNAMAAFLNSPILKIKEIYFVISSVCTNFVQKITTDEFIRYYWQIEKPVSVGQPLRYGDAYTHHGEAITVPNLKDKRFADADRIMADLNLVMVVNDTGYVKTLPPDCILSQSPAAGDKVKSGHVIYVTINSLHTPTLTIPDVIDNSSLREAMARLSAMGFRLGTPQRVPSEKDWVYGITVHGRHVSAGDRVAVDDPIVVQAGSGMVDEADSINFIDPFDENESAGEVDEFEEVKAPPTAAE